MGDDLLHVVGPRLQVQAGHLGAHEQRRTAPCDGVVADGPEPGESRVATHVADQQPLQRVLRAQLLGQMDVQAGVA